MEHVWGGGKGRRADIECALNKVIQREMQRRKGAAFEASSDFTAPAVYTEGMRVCILCNVAIGCYESAKPISRCCSLLRSQ